MPKFSKPWYREKRGLWYVTLNGRAKQAIYCSRECAVAVVCSKGERSTLATFALLGMARRRVLHYFGNLHLRACRFGGTDTGKLVRRAPSASNRSRLHIALPRLLRH